MTEIESSSNDEPDPEAIPNHPDYLSSSSSESYHSSPVLSTCASESDSVALVESHVESSSSLSCSDLFGHDGSAIPMPNSLKTYKIIGDNLDKNVKPSARDMRSDHQTRSLHYYHAYAVRDRIDLTNFEDSPSLPNLKDIDVQEILPSATDKNEIHSNFSFLVARVLKKHMAFFKKFGKGTVKRLRHEYSCEMGQKSEVVSTLIISISLGICCLFIIIIDSTWRDSSE